MSFAETLPAEYVAVAAVDRVGGVAGIHVVEAAEGGRHRVVTVWEAYGPPTTREWTPLNVRITLYKRL